MKDSPARIIRSRAPVRIDFAGGWTDVADFARATPGAVVNATVNLWTYATLTPSSDRETLEIFSADFEEFVAAKDIQGLEYNGQMDLVKAAARIMNVRPGLSIQTRSDAPPGSGLGTSAAMGVALLGALGELTGKPYLEFELAELASHIERHELGIKGGKQDHYASAIGGINFMEFHGETVRTAPIPLPDGMRMYLEKHLVLVYTGKSRLSGAIHADVWSAFESGRPETVGAIERMKEIARLTKDAFIAADIDGFAELMNENWRCQQALHPSVMNADLERVFDAAFKAGAQGGKACGAGGGGCVLFLARPEREHTLRHALESLPNVTILTIDLPRAGLQVACYSSDTCTATNALV